MVKIIASEGQKLMDVRNGKLHTEVVCEDALAQYFVLAEGEGELTVQTVEGSGTGSGIASRVAELEEELEAAKILLGVE